MKRIGLFGGTFNPVHVEHVNVIKNAIEEFNLDKILIIPSKIPPHKDVVPVSGEHRKRMLELATREILKAEVDDFELNRDGKSYTYITVEHYARVFKGDKLFLFIGEDMLLDFKTWKNPDLIMDKVELVAFLRDGFNADLQKEREYFLKAFGKSFIKASFTGEKVSSTLIRTRAALGLPIKNVDDLIEDYIKKNSLYAGDKYTKFLKKNLTEKRLVHTASVVETAVRKARETGISESKIVLAALLHDCAKYLDVKDFKDFKIDSNVPEKVVHAFLGEHVARTVLGVEDEEVLDAIKFHTTAKPNMSTLAKLIFVADMVEEGRNYEGVSGLRELFKGDLDFCFKECLKEEMIHLQKRGGDIYYLTTQANQYYNG